jgi:hypothetical protein
VYSDSIVPYLHQVPPYFGHAHYGGSGICTSRLHKRSDIELRYCMCDQNEIPGTILDLAVFKIVL